MMPTAIANGVVGLITTVAQVGMAAGSYWGNVHADLAGMLEKQIAQESVAEETVAQRGSRFPSVDIVERGLFVEDTTQSDCVDSDTVQMSSTPMDDMPSLGCTDVLDTASSSAAWSLSPSEQSSVTTRQLVLYSRRNKGKGKGQERNSDGQDSDMSSVSPRETRMIRWKDTDTSKTRGVARRPRKTYTSEYPYRYSSTSLFAPKSPNVREHRKTSLIQSRSSSLANHSSAISFAIASRPLDRLYTAASPSRLALPAPRRELTRQRAIYGASDPEIAYLDEWFEDPMSPTLGSTGPQFREWLSFIYAVADELGLGEHFDPRWLLRDPYWGLTAYRR